MRAILLPIALLSTIVAAVPAPTAFIPGKALDAREPLVTPSPIRRDITRTSNGKRDIISDLEGLVSEAESYAGDVLSSLGNVPSYVASGIPDFFQNFPTGEAVVSSLGLNDEQLAAVPTQALHIPPYANFTDQGWNIRFHGNIYKQPNITEEKLNDLANIFLIDTSVETLPQDQADMARNVTGEIFVVQQGEVPVSPIAVGPFEGGPGESQSITLPYNTTVEGDYDVFVPLTNGNGLLNGNETQQIQKLSTYVTNTTEGNATAYLVPNEGITIISDIDDILRITKIYDPKEGLLNSFARAYIPWEDMPHIYANWSQSLPNAHFHYLTTLPEQVTRTYETFIYNNYPAGSFDTRPLNFSDVTATLSIRQYLLTKIFETFPQRKFVLVADTSNSDVMKDYPKMAKDYPDQVQCIFLRNTTATDSADRFPYDTSDFEGLPQTQYMFFVNSDDLMGININGGSCYNTSVAQNLTYSYQGLPLGIGDTAPINGSAINDTSAARVLHANTGLTFAAFVSMLFWQLL